MYYALLPRTTRLTAAKYLSYSIVQYSTGWYILVYCNITEQNRTEHDVKFYTTLYYTTLYYTILYYTILYYTILYYTILYLSIEENCCTLSYYTPIVLILIASNTCQHTMIHQNAVSQLFFLFKFFTFFSYT